MIPERLKERREQVGLSQAELARKIYTTQQIISYYEAGERQPSVEMLRALADVLGCSTDYLLGRTDER